MGWNGMEWVGRCQWQWEVKFLEITLKMRTSTEEPLDESKASKGGRGERLWSSPLKYLLMLVFNVWPLCL